MPDLLALWGAFPQLARAVSFGVPALGVWFILCRCIEFYTVRSELRKALAPVLRPHIQTVFDLVVYPAKILTCGVAVLNLIDRMGTTKERAYVCRRAINSLQSSPLREWLLPALELSTNKASGILRILAMFWPACWCRKE